MRCARKAWSHADTCIHAAALALIADFIAARAAAQPAPDAGAAPPAAAPVAPVPAPNEAPALTPPRLIEAPALELPEGTMVPEGGIALVLAIDASGVVTAAELEQSLGAEIDAALIAGAKALKFEPARRGDQPIAARIGFRFEPAAPPVEEAAAAPSPEAAAEAGTATAQPPPPPPPPPEETFEAVARVDKPQPGAASVVKLRGRELTMVPGTFGEPLRVVATLPGVGRSPFGLGFFLVRGAAFQNTGFLVDGFAVPILYHLGAGPAVISSRLVEQLDFYPGGYPVAFGRYSAGVIALRTAPPPADRLQVEVEVDLLRASGLAIVPYGDGKGSMALAFRRSYYEILLPLITEDVDLSYTDYQVRLDHRFNDQLSVSLFFFGSRDHLAVAQMTGAGATVGTSASGVDYDSDQLLLSATYRPLPVLTVNWSAIFGLSTIDFGGDSTGEASIGLETQARRLGQRLALRYAPNEEFATTIGAEQSVFIYDVSGAAPSFAELPGIPAPSSLGESLAFGDRLAELEFAPYLEQVWRPKPFEFTAGLRVEYLRYADVSVVEFDPRGVVRFALLPEVTLKAASGLFTQPPLPFQLGRDAGNPNLAPTRAFQNSAGTEITLPQKLEIEATVFYSHMFQLSRPVGTASVDENGNAVRLIFDDDGQGRAYGFELLLRRRSERGLFGWLSYTLSRSERFLEGGQTVVFAFDQTHVGSLAASYGWDGWTFGVRFTLATGRPVNDLLDPNGDHSLYDADEDDYDGDSAGRRIRLPVYHQLDVRIDREWKLGPIDGSVFLDIINVYNALNSEGYQYSYDFTERGGVPGLPFLPTIGVKGVL